MPDDLADLKQPIFSTALNELDDLLAQSGNVFLIGAGCSKCAGLPADRDRRVMYSNWQFALA